LHKVVQGLAKQVNFFLISHLSILSVVEPKLYHRASTLQQIKQKKYAGPPTPATTLQGKKSKKTKPAAEKKPARLTARGPWTTAQAQRIALQN
jgi:hypothetical protein